MKKPQYKTYTVGDIRLYTLQLNIYETDQIVSDIRFKQYDYGTSNIAVQISKDNNPMDITNMTIKVMFKNSNNEFTTIELNQNDGSIINSKDGVIKVTVPDEIIQVSGKVQFEILLLNTIYKRLTTQCVEFDIIESILDSHNII